jgi:hypothetical protein
LVGSSDISLLALLLSVPWVPFFNPVDLV